MADKALDDYAAKMADTSSLKPIDGKAVIRSAIAVTNAGDGLSSAMKVNPQELHHGDTVFVVLECEVASVTFDPIDPQDLAGPQVRKHKLRAGAATLVDGDLVRSHIAAQKEVIDRAREKAAGVERMFEGDGEPTATAKPPAAKKAAAKKATTAKPAAKKAAAAKTPAKKAATKKATKAEEQATVTSLADRKAAAAAKNESVDTVDAPVHPEPEW
jgi:hypothetical protein